MKCPLLESDNAYFLPYLLIKHAKQFFYWPIFYPKPTSDISGIQNKLLQVKEIFLDQFISIGHVPRTRGSHVFGILDLTKSNKLYPKMQCYCNFMQYFCMETAMACMVL